MQEKNFKLYFVRTKIFRGQYARTRAVIAPKNLKKFYNFLKKFYKKIFH